VKIERRINLETQLEFEVYDIEIATKRDKTGLVGVLKVGFPVNPGELGRLLCLQKQHATMTLRLSSNQAQFDLKMTEVDGNGEIVERDSAGNIVPAIIAEAARRVGLR